MQECLGPTTLLKPPLQKAVNNSAKLSTFVAKPAEIRIGTSHFEIVSAPCKC